MADLGDIGSASKAAPQSSNYVNAARAQAVVAGTGAAPGASVLIAFGPAQVAAARADSSGDWTIGGLNNGTYWAAEVGALRAWLIEVNGATVTVTPQAGGGGGSTVIAGFAAAYVS